MMPIALECPCGKTLRVQDNLAGRRVKCPVCGEILEVAPATAQDAEVVFNEISSSPRPEPPATPPPPPPPASKPLTASVSGKAASASLGNVLVPSFFGRTTLTLTNGRVIEDTHKLIARRHAELLLPKIDSAEIVVAGNPVLLGLGLLLLSAYGLGLILLIVYFFKKNRFLVIRSQANNVVVGLQGGDELYYEFLEAVLAAAEATRSACH